jgi:hypothetical protein
MMIDDDIKYNHFDRGDLVLYQPISWANRIQKLHPNEARHYGQRIGIFLNFYSDAIYDLCVIYVFDLGKNISVSSNDLVLLSKNEPARVVSDGTEEDKH